MAWVAQVTRYIVISQSDACADRAVIAACCHHRCTSSAINVTPCLSLDITIYAFGLIACGLTSSEQKHLIHDLKDLNWGIPWHTYIGISNIDPFGELVHLGFEYIW